MIFLEEDIEFITFDDDIITKSDYREEIINKYIAANLDGMTKITDFTVGSEAYHVSDVMASFILEYRELIDSNYRMSMVHYAEGEFLDNFGDKDGIHRRGSSPSVGQVTFTRLDTTHNTKPIDIADGSQVATEDAISFIVDAHGEESITIEGGVDSITVDVICEQEGSYTNVEPNTITLVMGDLGSLVSVTNEEEFTDGEDIEEDDEYRARILLAPEEHPINSLAWYESMCLSLDSIHDVRAEKGQTQLDKDIIIYYNPINWEDTSIAESDLESLFTLKEYDIVGITRDYILAERVVMLPAEDDYLFAVLLKQNYTIDMVKADIVAKIEKFNSDAMIAVEFNPSSLASIIENEVEGVTSCRIVKANSDSYSEIVEPVSVDDNEVYQIDMSDINSRIVKIHFNIDIEVDD